MKVVCDASTLIALSRINALGLLEQQVTELTIPDAVYEELARGKNKPGIKKIVQAEWIQRKTVQNRTFIKQLHQSLHAGECETIALAKEMAVDFVILDDARARNVAEAEGLKVVGLLAILLNAKQNGRIKKIRPLLDALKQNGLFMKEDLYSLLLQKAGE